MKIIVNTLKTGYPNEFRAYFPLLLVSLLIKNEERRMKWKQFYPSKKSQRKTYIRNISH